MQTQAPAAEPSPTLGGGLSPLPLQKPPHPRPPAEQRPVPEGRRRAAPGWGGLCVLPLGPPYISLLLSTLAVVVSRVKH